MSGNRLFRKAALDKLSSPDQLDSLITVTSPKGWIALLMLAVTIIVAILWGIYGSIPTRVTGKGMLIKTGGIYNINHIAQGKISDVRIKVGDIIKKGDVIARVAQPDILENLRLSKEKLLKYKKDLDNLKDLENKKEEYQNTVIEDKIQNTKQSIKNLEKRLVFLKEKLNNQKSLVADGIITKQQVVETEERIKSTQQEIAGSSARINEFELNKVTEIKHKKEELNRINNQIKDMEYNIKELDENYFESSRIVSAFDGRVVEILMDDDSIISPGQTVARIELTGKEIKDLEAVIYIPVTDGKKVKTGMQVQISPSTVKKEEYGFITARVSKTSEYPVTQTTMMKVLGNQLLVKSLVSGGAPIEVYADLVIDSNNISGYKWSSQSGPPNKVFSGTMCDVTITVDEARPISLVIPALRKFFGI